ncbi:MAG TPA: fumarylacetoacetate hydrolase family protein [Xanthobacteraceae bacterium]|nr:fumarylacetoacetate hydrolase family protein [Xanthobacteraceae bacterium]
MAGYKLATYESAQGPRAGAVINDLVYDVAALTGQSKYASVLDALADWDAAHKLLDAAAKAPKGDGKPVKQAKLLAPVRWPGTIYCAGANYQDHAEEMWKAAGQLPQPDPHELGLKPWFFIKAARSVTDPDAKVSISKYSKKMDWEAELAVVIGRKARDLTLENALSCVAGYTVGNDLSARDLGFRPQLPESSPFRADWIRHKSFDGSCPLGPWIMPAAYVSNPSKLAIKLWVNDTLKQNSNSGNMIFTIAEQISHLSTGITLYPGDVIMTGTPAGVGAGRGEFLKAGDVVKVEIAEIGSITNTMT